MKANAIDPLKIWFGDFKVRYRVVLRRGTGTPPGPAPADGIVSRVPDISIDLPAEGSVGRRRILRLAAGGTLLTFWGRARPAPDTLVGHDCITRDVHDRRGRLVPAALIDRCCRTVHVLLDVPAARPFLIASDVDFFNILADAVLGDSIRPLLARGDEALVGSEVPAKVRALLAARPADEEKLLRGELSFLERLVRDCASLPASVVRRMEAIGARLSDLVPGAPRLAPSESLIERELSALRRLVEKRTISEIRFTDGEILGIANPAPEGSPRGRAAVGFRLSPSSVKGRTYLHLGPPSGIASECRGPVCLGNDEAIFVSVENQRDLYGSIDLVLNYLETNRVAALPTVDRATPRPAQDRPAENSGAHHAGA